MRQAIQTKYIGPTNTKGSKIKASCDAGSMTVPYDSSLSVETNHARAAKALIHRLGWGDQGRTKIIGGVLKNGYVFVLI